MKEVVESSLPSQAGSPVAAIYSLDGEFPHRAAWNDLEHVALTRDFLNDPDTLLRHLAE